MKPQPPTVAGDMLLYSETSINRAPTPIDRLFRKFCVVKRVTHGLFRNLFLIAGEISGKSRTVAIQDHSNAQKAIISDTGITFPMFYRLMVTLFGEDVIDLTVTLKNKDGQVTVLSTDASAVTITLQDGKGEEKTYKTGLNE